ncbi:MAG: helix-turn-helix transcriptional regulator [Oscillospiraceae bacterium]|nr:helix-turn-helix transcriptional regulator [Oscillospiraceae bacterium]
MKFWNTYLNLCNAVKKSPNAVAKEIGISSAAISAWKTNSDRIPQDRILLKIANYFNVPVETLKGNEALELAGVPVHKQGHAEPKRTELGQKENAPEYTEGERLLLDLFRQVPEEQQELVLQMIKAALGKM